MLWPKKIWRFLLDGDNRGALQFLLRIIGPVSIIGVGILIYQTVTKPPELAFRLNYEGGVTFTDIREQMRIEIANQGVDTLFAPRAFRCIGPTDEALDARIEFGMTTEDETRIAPGDISSVLYLPRDILTTRISVEPGTGILLWGPATDVTPEQVVASTGPQSFNCSYSIATAEENAVIDLEYAIGRADNGMMSIIPMSPSVRNFP